MKVFIVVPYYEDVSREPQAVFDSKEKAKAYIASETWYIEPDIFELELNNEENRLPAL